MGARAAIFYGRAEQKLDLQPAKLYNITMRIDEKYVCRQTGLDIKFVREAESTFDEIGSRDCIVAQSQKRGEGRGGRSFCSPKGGLYIVLRLSGENIDGHAITPAVGLAVRDAIQSVLGIDTRVKWVNDIYFDGKKVVGILCKCPKKGEYLVGIGINYATDIDELEKNDLGQVATSLNAPEEKVDAFLAKVLNNVIAAATEKFDSEKYASLCINIGKNVRFLLNGAPAYGYAEDVDSRGSLLVRMNGALIPVDAGEVSILRNSEE